MGLKRSVVAAVCGAALAALPMAAQSGWSVVKTYPIGGDGGWDYVTVDAPGHRVFVTRGSHAMAIDEDSGKVVGDVTGLKGSHGVAVVSKVGRGFVTEGAGSGSIAVFDLKTYQVLGHIAAMPDADGIIYDEKQDVVLVAAGDSQSLLTLKPEADPGSGKIDPPIALGGKPEFLASDGNGKVYVNLADKDVVAVVDLKTRAVVARWPVAPGGQPTGLAVDASGKHLFVGCRRPPMMVVLNTQTGKAEASLPIGTGVDATATGDGLAFASTGEGKMAVIGEKDGTFTLLQQVTTRPGARTMGFDAEKRLAFLPAAEMEPAATPGGRPRPKAGTFMILVVGRQ